MNRKKRFIGPYITQIEKKKKNGDLNPGISGFRMGMKIPPFSIGKPLSECLETILQP